MQKHRIFIAVNLPENVKKKLGDFEIKYSDVSARWTKAENLHITLIFIGDAGDNEVYEVCKIAKEVAAKHSPFFVSLNKVCFGPKEDDISPRMIWLKGEKSEELISLKNDLEKELLNSGKVNFPLENKGFSLHITLARIRQWDWKKIEPEERPQIDEDVDLNFPVNSIEVMESRLKRGGAEYEVVESMALRQ